MGKPVGGIGGGGCMGGGGNGLTPGGINIWLGGGGGILGGGGGGGIAGNGGLVDGSGGRLRGGGCCRRSFGGVGGGGKYGFCKLCGFDGTVEFEGLIPGGMGNCLAGEAFGVFNTFTFFVIAACIACSGVSTTIKIITQIILKLTLK